MDKPSKEDDVEKEVVFLAKNFQKFLKMNNSGKPFNRGKFSSPKGDRKEFRKKYGNDSQSTQGITCFKCNGHGHVKRECPNYLRMRARHMPQLLVIRSLPTQIRRIAMMKKRTSQHL